MPDLPASLLTAVIAAYWTTVVLKLAYVRWQLHRKGATVPRLASEQRIWPLWIATISGWHFWPALAITQSQAWYGLPGWSVVDPAWSIRMAVSGWAVLVFAATICCWIAMGRAWSVAVLPGEHVGLITRGPYALVRHPIYSLSIQLMLCTLVVVPNGPMAFVALTHILLMLMKVGIEERALAEQFGAQWRQYTCHTGRLWPKWPRATPQTIDRLPPAPPRFQTEARIVPERVEQ